MVVLSMTTCDTLTAQNSDRVREVLEAQELRYTIATNLIDTLKTENDALNLVLDRQIELINDYDDKIGLMEQIHRRERLQARSRGAIVGAGIMAGIIAVLKFIAE